MADNLSELRDALVRQMRRQDRYHAAGRAIDLPPQVVAPLNALAASVVAGRETAFATGYNSGSGTTTVALTWDMSVWGGGDVWTG